MSTTSTRRGPICPHCNGRYILHRQADDSYLCRRCGVRWARPNQPGSRATAPPPVGR